MAPESHNENSEIRIPRHREQNPSNTVHPQIARATSTSKIHVGESSYGTPDTKDWFTFTLELRTALGAGVSFVEALSLVATNIRSRSIRQGVSRILTRLNEGLPLDKALNEARSMPPIIRNLLLLGARGGNLPEALTHAHNHFQWILEMRGRILRAIAYPAALTILGALVMVFRDSTIAVLKNHADPVDALIKSGFEYFLPIFLAAGAATVIAWVLYTPLVRPGFDKIVLTAPVIGKMVHRYAISTFYRALGSLMDSGMPITNAWILAAQSVPNVHVARRLETGLHYLQDGESLETALRHTGQIPKEARTMAAVSAVSGSDAGLLRRYADFMEQEMKLTFKAISTLLWFMCMPLVALGFFCHPWFLALLAFVLVLLRRMV